MSYEARFDHRVPAAAWIYGLLGLIPFAAGAAATLAMAGAGRAHAQLALMIYGGLILTFLGGGRWGLEIGRGVVRPGVISGSMAGAVVSTLLVAAEGVTPGWRLLALALAHIGQWAWDIRTVRSPAWYAKLRHVLTAGAVLSLLVGSAASLKL